jgi:hypothetical protein
MIHGKNKIIEKFHPTFAQWFMNLIFFDLLFFKLTHELTLNPLLLFHHVVHIQKYLFFELT